LTADVRLLTADARLLTADARLFAADARLFAADMNTKVIFSKYIIILKHVTLREIQFQKTTSAYKIDSSVIRQLKILFHDIDSMHKAKPKGQHGSEIRWMILASPPASVKKHANSAFDTNSPFTLEFDETERGKTIFLSALGKYTLRKRFLERNRFCDRAVKKIRN
jgi:hypothetical protein